MRSVLRLLLLLVLPLCASAQSSLPPCPTTGYKNNCFGTTSLANGDKSFADQFEALAVLEALASQGTYTSANGDKYVGEFKDGKPNGKGTHTFANGNKYVGEFKDGKYNGQGIRYSQDGSILQSGQWADGKLVQSLFLDRNRFPFDASSVIAQTTPQPVAPESSGLTPAAQSSLSPCLQGPAVDWHNCQGEIKSRNEVYVGEFRFGRKHGWGVYESSWGSKYVGEFKNGSYEGKGWYRWEKGERYVGMFEDGMRTGEGIEYSADGKVSRSGRWVAGTLVEAFPIDKDRFPFVAPPATEAERERERFRAEVEAERRKRQEAEEQLARERERVVLAQSPTQNQPVSQASSIRSAHALVIGNAAYRGSSRLDNPVNDANAISQKLRSMGFTVTTVTDANRQRLVQAMTQFKRTAASADLSLLFYSGHGVQIFGQNYILPTDVDQSDVAQATIQGVSLNNVVESFLPGQTKLVFLDACRDNPLQRTSDRSVSKGLAPMSVAQGTLIAYATKDGQTASDGPGQKNSPFTQALLQHLSDPSDIGVVLRRVREKVMQATGGKQQPWDYGSLTGGELVLARVKQ